MPALKASTVPVEPTVATVTLLLLHVPPETLLVKVVEPPVQSEAVPPIAAGEILTVSTVLAANVPHPFEMV